MIKNNSIYMILFCFLIIGFFLFIPSSKAQSPVDPSSIIGKVVCGYQGWFSCAGDGSPINAWFHWSGTTPPAPGNLSFEIYPDVSPYDSSSLFQTGFANLGNGQPSKLFSSYKEDVIDDHFALMQDHGIDGVGLQRFVTDITGDSAFKANRDTITARVKRSAEEYDRLFYVMYDISGLLASKFDSMKTDWQNNIVGTLHLTSSPMYAKQDGNPVVCIWGFGFTDRAGTASECLAVINWFKAQGCYVIGGVPTNWRTCTGDSKPGFENVYKAFHMISPWSVGRFNNIAGVNSYKTNYLIPDLSYCNTWGMAYQPVLFPGFAWSNWNGGTKNQIPRIRGEFLWQQVYNIKSLNIPGAYMAMFDEYDEGTALLNMADSYFMIPTNQYFLTSSADGTYISSDFYLRLAGKATRVIKGIDPVTTYVPISYSEGPVYFRTSHESNIDALPNWTSTTEAKVNVSAYGSNSGNPACAVIAENPHGGSRTLRIQGRDQSATTSYAYFKVFDVNIPVYSNTYLRFWTYPANELGRYVSVDLIMTDNSNLRDSGALDENGVSMHPAAGRGTVNAWTNTTSHIGSWLNGKTIDRILVAYDHAPETGDFRAYIDDISIDTGAVYISVSSWTGVTSTSWTDPANWSSGVPTSTSDVYISSGAPHMPVISTGGGMCRNLTVNTGAILSISGSNSLTVYGNWTNNGTFSYGTSTVIFAGSSDKIISGWTEFYNLVISKDTSTLKITDPNEAWSKTSFEVKNDLIVSKGTLDLYGTDWNYFIGNDIIIAANGTLNVNLPYVSFPVSVKRNWTNNGGTFNPGNCTVRFDGSGTQVINGSATNQTFYNFAVEKTAGTNLSVSSTITLTVNELSLVSGNFTAPSLLNINSYASLSGGIFTAGANTYVKGNWTNNGATFTPGTGMVTFNGDSQSINGTVSPQTFNNLTIGSSTAATLNVDAILAADLIVNNGKTLIISPGKILTVMGKVTIK